MDLPERNRHMKYYKQLLLILCSSLLLVGCGGQKDFRTGSSDAGNIGVKNTVAEKEDNQQDDLNAPSDFEKKFGSSPQEMRYEPADICLVRDEIEVTLQSPNRIFSQTEKSVRGTRLLEMEDLIGEFGVENYLINRPLTGTAEWNVEAFEVREYEGKRFKFAAPYGAYSNSAALFYPIDDGHFLKIEVSIIDCFEKDGSRKWWNCQIEKYVNRPEFAELVQFVTKEQSFRETDPYKIVDTGAEGFHSEWESYLIEWGEIANNGYEDYYKNSLSICTESGIEEETARNLVQALAKEYSFYVVGYMEFNSTFEIEFTEDKTYEELETLGREFEKLPWVSLSHPIDIIPVSLNSW